ncbi:EIN3-binding F-box protein 1 [Athalia rosae]|uniref:EIN3-binding F-box protein 1 n=1 Tax=Athalia rosae TaxID=37344 RepID=UPI0020337AB7|nr:EIN3-binding F-box protein 1 [Athalia rosae]
MAITNDSLLEMLNTENCDIPQLPTEVLINIMSYLYGSDRNSAGLVCTHWHGASLATQFINQQVISVTQSSAGDNLHTVMAILNNSVRPFYNFVFKDVELRGIGNFWEKFGPEVRSLILVNCNLGERTLVEILKGSENLQTLHINTCRECFMSGRLLDDPNDVRDLSKKLINLKELSLASNRYLSDALFNRIVNICPNLISLSLSGCQISFHSGLYKKFYPNDGNTTHASESVLTFCNILNFLKRQAKQLKYLSFGSTLIDGTALVTLSTVEHLELESLKLHGCDQLTNIGIRSLTEYQKSLKVLDVSFCTRVTDASLISISTNLVNLEVLSVRRCRAITDHGIKQIRRLKHLKELDISECEQLTGDCITKGLCSTNWQENSKSEVIQDELNYEEPIPDPSNSISPEQTELNNNLDKLYANALNLDEKSILSIATNCSKLTVLDLGYCFNAVTDNCIQMIFKELVLLRSLTLSRCDKVSDLGLTGMGAGNRENVKAEWSRNYVELPEPQLRIRLGSKVEAEIWRDAKRKREVTKLCEDLSMPCNNDASSGFSLVRLRGLKQLNLAGCIRITDVSLKYAFNFPELRILDLSLCQQITHEGLDFLTKNNRALEELHLSQCHNVTDIGISYIAKRLHRLKRLYLQGCSQLTDHSLDSIKIHCSSLQFLDVKACRGMSVAGIESLVHLNIDYSKEAEDMVSSKKPPPAPPMRR